MNQESTTSWNHQSGCLETM